ncbi:hypothetical protein BDW75DRAFT_236249 [Aspergillus navahoensis]
MVVQTRDSEATPAQPQPYRTAAAGDESSSTDSTEFLHGPLVCRKWVPRSSSRFQIPQEISVQEVLETNVLELEGTHVFFLPRITDIQKDSKLAEKLAQVFHIDSYFLSQSAYESNGFFHIEKTPVDGLNGTCITSSSRALVKEIWEPSPDSGELINRIVTKKEDDQLRSEIISVPNTAAEVLVRDIEKLSASGNNGTAQAPAGTDAVSLAKRAAKASTSASEGAVEELVDKFGAARLDPKTLDKLSDLLTGQIHQRECIMKDLKSDQNVEKPSAQKHGNRGVNTQRDSEKPIKYMYHWLFLAFFTLWVKRHERPEPAQVILCFDDAHGKRIERAISKASADISSPYSIISRLAESVTLIFDDALWSFRTPIRQIEKNRTEFARNAMSVIVHDPWDEPSPSSLKDGIIDVYAQMHELARHVIHFQETIEAAKTCSLQMVQSAELHCKDESSVSRIKHWALLAHNLKPRADGFKERLQNEIALVSHPPLIHPLNYPSSNVYSPQQAYNTVNAQQLGEARSLLQESRSDGKHISWMVGFLSIVFLPGTFVSGFFSMTFFDTETRDAWWHDTPNVWLYFAITIPLTVTGLVTFWLRRRRSVKLRGQHYPT